MIRVLEDRVINKIAAGEVVERPASIVKELVENAIDAGATVLRVELKAGGRTLIRVSDNGSGMDRHDATLCLERHATSKIRSDEDLFTVSTLGFRGEALPSIAAIGRFELLSRRQGDEVGTRVVVEGGRLMDISDAGCPEGTEITLRSIFFNIPARRKFLRTAGTELSHCLEAVTRQVLTRPEIDVEVVHDGKTVVRAPRVETIAHRTSDLLGPHGRALVPISFKEGPLELEALVSPVGVHRASGRGASYLYVNGRFVSDMVLRRAIREAYRGLVPKGRFPTVVVNVTVPPDHVDVNVHPAKTEVRFRFAYDLTEAVGRGIRLGLESHGIKKPVATEARYQPEFAQGEQSPLPLGSSPGTLWRATPVPADPLTVGTNTPRPGPSTAADNEGSPIATPSHGVAPFVLPTNLAHTGSQADSRDLLPVARFADLQVLGQLAKTYLLCEGAGELVVIDQHAAHERVMLHQLMKDPERHLGTGKRFLTPAVIELNASRAAALVDHLDGLAGFGFEIEAFGGNSVAVKQVPAALGRIKLQRLIEDVADDIAEGGKGRPADDVVEHVLATMACHSAIRAGQTLSLYEMRALLTATDRVDFSVCAHGRPVSIRISAAELEKRFHRT
jgi:DNA mismatch repair protein MutL